MRLPVMTVEELTHALSAEFPHLFTRDSGFTIEAVWHGGCRVRQG